VVVGPAAGEAHQVRAGPIGTGQPGELGGHVGLRQAGRKVEAPGEAQRGGDAGEEVIGAPQAEISEHAGEVLVGVRHVVSHQAPRAGLWMKGKWTTWHAMCLPLASTSTTSPSTTSVGRKAMPIPQPRTGEKLPLVSSPAAAPSRKNL
jgi:hypothetical protein